MFWGTEGHTFDLQTVSIPRIVSDLAPQTGAHPTPSHTHTHTQTHTTLNEPGENVPPTSMTFSFRLIHTPLDHNS